MWEMHLGAGVRAGQRRVIAFYKGNSFSVADLACGVTKRCALDSFGSVFAREMVFTQVLSVVLSRVVHRVLEPTRTEPGCLAIQNEDIKNRTSGFLRAFSSSHLEAMSQRILRLLIEMWHQWFSDINSCIDRHWLWHCELGPFHNRRRSNITFTRAIANHVF